MAVNWLDIDSFRFLHSGWRDDVVDDGSLKDAQTNSNCLGEWAEDAAADLRKYKKNNSVP